MPRKAVPEYHSLEYAKGYRSCGAKIKEFVLKRPGVIAAWVGSCAFHDFVKKEETKLQPLFGVVLVDPGFEGGEAFEYNGVEVSFTCLCYEMVEECLLDDIELAGVIAQGYRLCGEERVVFELEKLAQSILCVKRTTANAPNSE